MVLSLIQDAPQNAKVAAVVSFYMMSALVVCRLLPFLPNQTVSHFCTRHVQMVFV
jgi:hypothetical protein